MHQPSVGIVLSGGGARGAYEAGILKYIFQKFGTAERPLFDVLTGSSVGAVHAAYVTGSGQAKDAADGLAQLWLSMQLGDTVRINWSWLRSQAWRTIFGSKRPMRSDQTRPAVFDTCHLEKLIFKSIDWRGMQRELRSGRVKGVALPSTEIGTGRAAVFYQAAEERPEMVWRNDPHIDGRAVRLMPRHVFASAAIPMFFPPVKIDNRLFVDGSLRINTPLSPALRLGAEKLLVIRLRSPEKSIPGAQAELSAAVASPAYLAGKAFDAIMLDPVDRDLKTLDMINALTSNLMPNRPDLSDWSREHRGATFRPVEVMTIAPSESLATLASEALKRIPKVPRLFRRYIDAPAGDSDLLSYFLFDAEFTANLIDLGYGDAQASHVRFETLFSA